MKNWSLYIIIIFLSVFCMTGNSFSQNGWVKQNSPLPSFLTDIFMINSQTGWITGFNATILKTTNSGFNWVTQNSTLSKEYDLNYVFFVSDTVGWISGHQDNLYFYTMSTGPLLKTTNGGNTWFENYFNSIYRPKGIYFINAQTGWMAVEPAIITGIIYVLKTTNGGSNWSIFQVGNTQKITSVYFVSEQTGWIGGSNSSIFKTTDGGENWTLQFGISNGSVVDFSFTTPDNGWCARSYFYGTVYKTTNGGTNWSAISLNTIFTLDHVYFVDNSTGWVAGEYGNIYYTIDSGNSWSERPKFTKAYISRVRFINSTTGWIVGESGTIFKTTTGGF